MQMLTHFGPFTPLDGAALLLLVLLWLATDRLIEHPPAKHPSVSILMQDYRREWMRTFVTREPRIFDATVIESLRQGTAFFASASMIAIGGGLALIGSPGSLTRLAGELTLSIDDATIQMKILVVVGFLSNALLKFVWSNRLFGYCAVLMAAVPNEAEDPLAFHRAAQAAEVNITAARSFNRGLRSIYFALATIGWLLGPLGLVAATLLATGVLMRREFASQSRTVILDRTGT
ncbi:MAG: DUF599 domain-containing protein [Tabrizicola sp.]|nr:DUF599 domain-containing protein [Tabrizicola sp.]